MKIIKRINKNEKYVARNGKEYTSTNYYIELDNGSWVAVKPVFSKDYVKLDTISITVING